MNALMVLPLRSQNRCSVLGSPTNTTVWSVNSPNPVGRSSPLKLSKAIRTLVSIFSNPCDFEERLRTEQRFGVALRIVRDWGVYEHDDAAITLQIVIR